MRGRVDVTNEGRDTPLPREVQDTIDDLFDLVTVWEDYAKKADSQRKPSVATWRLRVLVTPSG